MRVFHSCIFKSPLYASKKEFTCQKRENFYGISASFWWQVFGLRQGSRLSILVTLPVECRNLAALAVGHITPEFYFFKVLRINHKKGFNDLFFWIMSFFLEIIKKNNKHPIWSFSLSNVTEDLASLIAIAVDVQGEGRWWMECWGRWVMVGPAKGEICKVWRLATAQLQATGEISRNQDVLGALQFEDEGSEPTEKTQFFVVLIWMGIDILALFSDLSCYTKVTYETFEPKIRVTIGLVWSIYNENMSETHWKIQGHPTF